MFFYGDVSFASLIKQLSCAGFFLFFTIMIFLGKFRKFGRSPFFLY